MQLEKNYGVVRFRGTLAHNRDHVVVFQSDDVVETMAELERRCAVSDPDHGYMIIVRSREPVPPPSSAE